jgi:hypothetical protein
MFIMSDIIETKRRGPGRPPVTVDWQVVLQHAKEGKKNTAICEAMNIIRSHFQKMLRDPIKRMEIGVARAKGAGDVLAAVYRGACEGKASLAQMYLRMTGRW